MNKINSLFKGKVKYNTLILGILLLLFVVLHINEQIYDFGTDPFNWFSTIIWFISEMGFYFISIFVPYLNKVFADSDPLFHIMYNVFPYVLYALVLTLLILSWHCFMTGNIRKYANITNFLYILYGVKISAELFCFLLSEAFLLDDMGHHFIHIRTFAGCLMISAALSLLVSFLIISFGFKNTDKIIKEIKNEA